MDDNPIIHNLLFEDQTPNQSARMTFTYNDENGAQDMALTIEMVRKGQVRVAASENPNEETFFINCEVTILHLGPENLSLFEEWSRRYRAVTAA